MKDKSNLSDKQKEVIRVLRKYPTAIIMYDYWLTGGHGVKLDARSVKALRDKGIVNREQLTELGKTINIDN